MTELEPDSLLDELSSGAETIATASRRRRAESETLVLRGRHEDEAIKVNLSGCFYHMH